MEAVIVLNGNFKSDPKKYKEIIRNNYLIAADGGASFLDKINLLPDVIIGDMDSLSKEKINKYKNKKISLIKFPVEKDKTDGELAIDYCNKNNFDKIIIMGCQGGRVDQQLANIFLLEYSYQLNLNGIIKEPGLEIGLIQNKKILKDKENWNLSLIPLVKKVKGVSIKGCKYEVDDQTLYRYKTLGLSNKITEKNAVITTGNGLLIYIIFKKEE